MQWTDIDRIAAGLAEQHPDTEPLKVDFLAIRDRVAGLNGFRGDPTRVNLRILESIQLAWLDRTGRG
ncbi:Fe-S assembly protein IscX [Streptomyces griseocarneus]|nr:Fe-S assembly protein IscX [Streptomyces griseocarneus]